jgi:hypothetical protein
MQTLNTAHNVNGPSELWWAHSPAFGWVVQDRSLFVNRCWDVPEEMLLTRSSDHREFEQGDRSWDYKEASRYLASLSPKEAFEQQAELETFKQAFCSQILNAA